MKITFFSLFIFTITTFIDLKNIYPQRSSNVLNKTLAYKFKTPMREEVRKDFEHFTRKIKNKIELRKVTPFEIDYLKKKQDEDEKNI